jgi:hypothetical protein
MDKADGNKRGSNLHRFDPPRGLIRLTPLPEPLGTTVFEGVVWSKAA